MLSFKSIQNICSFPGHSLNIRLGLFYPFHRYIGLFLIQRIAAGGLSKFCAVPHHIQYIILYLKSNADMIGTSWQPESKQPSYVRV